MNKKHDAGDERGTLPSVGGERNRRPETAGAPDTPPSPPLHAAPQAELLREARDEIVRIHHNTVKPAGLFYHDPGTRPNLCRPCALIAKLDAALLPAPQPDKTHEKRGQDRDGSTSDADCGHHGGGAKS